MVGTEDITAFVHRIAEEFFPERIILFGSYAYGKPTPNSDVDLLVILPFKGEPYKKAVEIRQRVAPTFALDLLVRTPEVMKWRTEQGDFFLLEIVEKGKVLYEAPHGRVGRKGRERLRKRPARAARVNGRITTPSVSIRSRASGREVR